MEIAVVTSSAMPQPRIQLRWVRSISIGGARPSLRDPEELRGLDALEGVVRAGVDAGRLVILAAQVAGGGLLPDDRLALPRTVGVLTVHHERMQIDVAVRALGGAEPAADDPVLDDGLERVRVATDRADRAAHHAQRVTAGSTRGGHEELVVAQSGADEAGGAPRGGRRRRGAGR